MKDFLYGVGVTLFICIVLGAFIYDDLDCNVIPPQDVYYMMDSGGMPMLMTIEKGQFNSEKQGRTWYSAEDIERKELDENYQIFSRTMKQMLMLEQLN